MDFFRFFVKSFLFFFAMILAGYISIRLDLFPPPPPAWVKAISDIRDSSQNIEKTASSLENTAGNLAKTAGSLIEPLKGSLDLAKKIVDKLPPVPAIPGAPTVPGAPGMPQLPVPLPPVPAPPVPLPSLPKF
jgi:hypothetical protein